MKAVILAAGEGQRMRPLTYTRPKVMIHLAGKPILEHLLLEIRKAGLEDFIFVVGYKDEAVRNHFQEGRKWGVKIEYAYQGKQLGTAHALKMVEEFVESEFLLANGDIFVNSEDIAKLLKKGPLALGVARAENSERYGLIEIEDERVIRIREKVKEPSSNLVNAGIYLLDRRVFEALAQTEKSPRGEFELTDSLQILIDKGQVIFPQELEYWLDAAYPWELLEANKFFLSRLIPQNLGVVEENAVIKGAVSIGKGTVIKSGSYILGPVIIGEDCEIGPNCFIRPATSIGDRCHIGAAVEVKNSIIMNETKIPHHNYVGDSIIGEGVNLGAGTKIANLRLDKNEVSIAGIPTGLRKLGAIIGDKVEVGINASINVGSLIGDHTFIGPGAVVGGIIQPGSKIF